MVEILSDVDSVDEKQDSYFAQYDVVCLTGCIPHIMVRNVHLYDTLLMVQQQNLMKNFIVRNWFVMCLTLSCMVHL